MNSTPIIIPIKNVISEPPILCKYHSSRTNETCNKKICKKHKYPICVTHYSMLRKMIKDDNEFLNALSDIDSYNKTKRSEGRPKKVKIIESEDGENIIVTTVNNKNYIKKKKNEEFEIYNYSTQQIEKHSLQVIRDQLVNNVDYQDPLNGFSSFRKN